MNDTNTLDIFKIFTIIFTYSWILLMDKFN